ncbi:GNAT family N-acetyltransferase [Leucobacter celer]|jgi:putative acetyltransferase|uniref:GNAT family N-acetyltransferase n=1 Tax=Leucobacter celer TaxID=668625 RepID=UPI0006A75B05|nr:GNAT family N-acetyltransferase [Leucobacter celer]
MHRISRADLADPRLIQFLHDHLRDLLPTAPPESRHALDLSGLCAPGVRVWAAADEESVLGTVALASLDSGHEELKSMRTDPARRGEGIASALLEHALADARERAVTRVSLETGSMEFFAPARGLYRKTGFQLCQPFGSYREDPNSVFMTLAL